MFGDEAPLGCCGVFAKHAGKLRVPWAEYEAKVQRVLEWIRSPEGGNVQGPVGAIGFCYGAWQALRVAGMHPCPIVAAVGYHPALYMQYAQPGGEPRLDKIVELVQVPVMLAPTKPDPASVQPGGKYVQMLASNKGCEVHAYPTQQHGFVNRGDVSLPTVGRDVEDALARTCIFFKQHGF